jgi:hypothetical protein
MSEHSLMKKNCLWPLILIIWVSCTTHKPIKDKLAGEPLIIHELNANRRTSFTKQNLEQLIKVYDLNPIFFTRIINIQTGVIPQSHPVLTLNTRYAEDPYKLLASFIHEQLHWWVESQSQATERAMLQLRKQYPNNDQATNLHLIICYLEYRLLVHYLGEEKATMLLDELINIDGTYPWIYTEVTQENSPVVKIVQENELLPPPIN